MRKYKYKYEPHVYQQKQERGPFDPERYAKWRAQIPFSDDQIIEALTEEMNAQPTTFLKEKWKYTLDYFEKHRTLSSNILRLTLPRLVKFCAICGKTALYRMGCEGRCRAHRMVASKGWAFYKESQNNRSQAINNREKEYDALEKFKNRIRNMRSK